MWIDILIMVACVGVGLFFLYQMVMFCSERVEEERAVAELKRCKCSCGAQEKFGGGQQGLGTDRK